MTELPTPLLSSVEHLTQILTTVSNSFFHWEPPNFHALLSLLVGGGGWVCYLFISTGAIELSV